MITIYRLIIAGILAFLLLSTKIYAFSDPNDMYWYMAQTKCVYNGSVVSWLPYLIDCPGSVQLQTVDDPAFYSERDWPRSGIMQADDSVIGWRNGRVVVISTFDWGPPFVPFGYFNYNDGARPIILL